MDKKQQNPKVREITNKAAELRVKVKTGIKAGPMTASW
jgi:hypothetical protein